MTEPAITAKLFSDRETYSQLRLKELERRLTTAPQTSDLTAFTIFAAGSYGRLEASEHSDIDLFFLYETARHDLSEPRTAELRLFGALIEIVDSMGFPKFSNDCQYLSALSCHDILTALGSPADDFNNYFTVRMLLLLESKCLYGQTTYDDILRNIIGSYYRDYPDHQATFEPWFLLNDIGRFWKTLLLNYEHKRNQPADSDHKAQQKVRNFKLKFSRMTTCFATVAALGCQQSPVPEQTILELIRLTPRQRLQAVLNQREELRPLVQAVLDGYAWFLEQTAQTTEQLVAQFDDKQQRTTMFTKANEYGDSMFQLLEGIETSSSSPTRLVRYLVI
ncbi:MAG TPA: hypothetical protein VGP46_12305 [Acidimicrobiales bacterium]|nr:hypothetical protein [Acidimicrobiales bacterium]